MHDCILLENLAFDTIIGVLDHERVTPQPILANVTLFFDFKTACESDALEDTIDYFQLEQELNQYVQQTQFELIERLAQAMCTWMFEQYPIQKIRLELRKPQALDHDKMVGVIIERERPQLA